MKNIFKRITVLTLITSIILSNNICQVSAKEKDINTNRTTFQISPNESLDISLLETKGIVKSQKTTHPSKTEVAVTTTQYYFDDVSVRKQVRDEINSELSDVDEVQALYTEAKYQTKFDTTCSYEFHSTVYWTTYVNNNGITYGRIESVSGGYTQRDWTISVVSQYLSVGACAGTSRSVYNSYITPQNSNWTVYTYDYVTFLPISTGIFGCMGGAYYDIELKRNAGSWISEIYTTCWSSGGINLSDFLDNRKEED